MIKRFSVEPNFFKSNVILHLQGKRAEIYPIAVYFQELGDQGSTQSPFINYL